MKKLWKKLLAVTTAMMMAITLLPAMANAESTFTQETGKFRIKKTDAEDKGLTGAEFLYYKVYDIDSSTGKITINSSFENVSEAIKTKLNDMITKNYTRDQELSLANELKSYISANNIQPGKKNGANDVLRSGADGLTDYAGATSFGYYLIVETKAPDKQGDKTYVTGDPFFLALPGTGENGKWTYDVTSKPKVNRDGITGPEKKIVTTGTDSNEILVDKKDVNVGDIVKYQIKVQIPQFTDKSFEVTNNMPKLTITDTMDKNLTILNDTQHPIEIKVDNRLITKDVSINSNKGTGNTYTAFSTVLQANNDFGKADCGKYVTVTYFAQVDNVDADVFTNTASVKVNDDSELPGNTPELYTYGIELTKTLAGAVPGTNQKIYFDLYKEVNGAYQKVSNLTTVISNNKTSGDDQEKGQFVTDKDGKILIKGLSLGKYALRETTTVDGYTLLTEDVEFILEDSAPDGKLDINGKNIDSNILAKSVDNKKGFNMPSTGGMGTYLFTIGGLVIMAGAAFLLLVSKKRRA